MNAKELIQYFCNEFRKKYKHPYPIRWAIDTKIINSLLKDGFGDTQLKRFMWMHLHECTAFVKSRGHVLALLKSQIPDYIVRDHSNSVNEKFESSDHLRLGKLKVEDTELFI